MNEKTFGTTISKRRKEKKFTQKQLAEILHVSDKAVSRWETDASLPDIDMIQTIAYVLELEFEELLKFKVVEKDEVTLNTIVKEYENKTNKLKSKYRKILFIIIMFSLFLLLILFFLTTYNKFKLYDIAIVGDHFYNTNGVYIDTNLQDYFYLGSILLDEDVNIENCTLDVFILDNKKEVLLKHYDDVYKNIQFELDNSYTKKYDINENFDKVFIRIKDNKTNKEYIGQITFVSRFSNNKLFYLKENKKKLDDINDDDRNKRDIINKLDELGFKKKNKDEYVNEKEHLIYYINAEKIIYEENDNNFCYKYIYYLKLNRLEVSIFDTNSNVESVIERYIYNLKSKDMNCIVGQCVDYKKIMNIFDKYVKVLK